MTPKPSLSCEVLKSTQKDEHGNQLTTVKCYGRVIAETAGKLKEVVAPLLPLGGRIVVDLGEVSQLDSSGLGTLVGLKVSAVRQGLCILEFSNMTPRVLELLRITNLMQLFSS